MKRMMYGPEHNIFTNATILFRQENLMKKEKGRFDELGIKNLVDLCRYCTINEIALGSVLVCIHQFNNGHCAH